MKKKFIALTILFFTTVMLFSSSNKTDSDLIETINKNITPYRDNYLEFTIITNEILMSNYEDKNIFKVILDHGKLDIKLTEKYKDLGSTKEENEFLEKALTEISMLLKYLAGFYFGNGFSENILIYENSENNMTLYNEYTYDNLDCINYYSINDYLLKETQVFHKNNSQVQVDTKYFYKTYQNRNYLKGFNSKNNFHSFDFSLVIDYSEKNNILVPTKFTVKIKQNIDNQLVNSRFIITAENHIIK